MAPFLCLKDYARILKRRGKPNEAEALVESVLRVKRARLGENDFQVANALMVLAELFEEWREHARQESICRAALAIYCLTGREKRWRYPDCLECLARACRKQNKVDQTAALEKEAAAVRSRRRGNPS